MNDYLRIPFPVQKLSIGQKNEQWRKKCVDSVIGREKGFFANGNDRYQRMKIDYDLYNGIYDENDLRYLVDPYNVKEGFPAVPRDMNIIRPKINLLFGEETTRTNEFRIIQTNDSATSKMTEQAKQMLINYVMQDVKNKMGGDNEEQVLSPDEIKKYLSREYKDVAEQVAYHTLKYLSNKLNLDHELLRGWEDALVAGEEVYYIGILNGDPVIERVNPLFFSYDKTPDVEFIEDGEWCLRRMFMNPSEIYDRFYDKLKKSDLDKLLQLVEGNTGPTKQADPDFNRIVYKENFISKFDPDETNHYNLISVYHACWKSFKKIGFKQFVDEFGETQETIVDETYEALPGEKIEWDWVIEVWEGYRIGDDIYVDIKPIEYQHVSIDNPNSQKLPYTGVRYSNINSRSRSLVDIMKPLQYMYIVLWYRLELALSRDKGKIINVDITQIPKSMGVDVPHWMHYLTSIGVNFINPYEDGWDVPGREGGKPSQFNQFSSVDLTMSNVIAQYIQLMDKIEDMAGELSGVTKQREGQINSSELVGNVQRSVNQSAHITEILFWYHNQAKKRVITMLLDTAKFAWKVSNKKSLHYMLDDQTRVFLKISEDFFYSDFDIFVTNATKEAANIQALQSLIQPAMQNGATLLDAAEILTLENMTAIKNKLAEIEEKRKELQQQQQQQEYQQQQQLQQMKNEEVEKQMAVEREKMDLERHKIDTDNQTKISVAQMNLQASQEQADQSNRVTQMQLQQKSAAEERKMLLDANIKSAELQGKNIDNYYKTQLSKVQLASKQMELENNSNTLDKEAQIKNSELFSKVQQLNTQIEIKQKELEIKQLESDIKEKELEVKEAEVDSKNIESQSKFAELDIKDRETSTKENEVLLHAQEIEDNKEISDRDLDLRERELENELKSEKIQLASEKVKLNQMEIQLKKSKIDSNKSKK